MNSFTTIIMIAIGIVIELLTVPYWGIAAVMLMIGYMAIYLVILYMIGEIKNKIKRG